jgi:vacuolar-type H+-ATPase subunit H
MRFSDATWAHSDQTAYEHYASREEIYEVANKYDMQVEMITGSGDVERALVLQNATDMLLDELSGMLRAEYREQAELSERVRKAYAAVFTLLTRDAARCREVITDLENQKNQLEENLTKVIDNATERVRDAQQDCEKQIFEMKREMEDKKDEYDNSMKRFLEQKAQLEEHVKALHRVFLDFQSDSVYITLEELKANQVSMEKKIRNKENEISKLNQAIGNLQKQILDGQNQKALVEQANDDLRRKLQNALATANRLQRRLEMRDIEDGGNFHNVNIEEDIETPKVNPLLGAVTEIIAEAAETPTRPVRTKESRSGVAAADTTPYFSVLQRLGQVTDRIANFIQSSAAQVMLPPALNEETDKIMLSGNTSLMIKAILMKTNEVLQYAECLDNMDVAMQSAQNAAGGNAGLPRFLQYIRTHNQNRAKDPNKGPRVPGATMMQVRQILNAKYLSDKMNERMGRSLCRFPEFVLGFYSKDGDNLFTALSKSARLWRTIEGVKTPELRLFRHFLTEKMTVDELSFFVEARHTLLGDRRVSEDDSPVLTVAWQHCLDYMSSLLGAFSPVLATITQEAQKHVVSGQIDHALFLSVLTTYYQNERRRRRNAVRLMFQSKGFGKGEPVDFENFVGMIQALGFQGSQFDVFNLYREGIILGGGILTLDSFLKAMDSLSFHFYSIDLPMSVTKKTDVTKMARHHLVQHWVRFGAWFNAFKQPLPEFDPWLRSYLISNVGRVDQLFKSNSPVSVLYSEYRRLLDIFQFAMDVVSRVQREPMSLSKSERHFALLENLIDLLVTFIMRDADGDIVFTEIV